MIIHFLSITERYQFTGIAAILFSGINRCKGKYKAFSLIHKINS
jgi:hypothetical protein